MQFYLFFIHPQLKDLLLEELKRRHSKLSLSFSNKEFLSMKGPEGYEVHLEKNPLVFAKRMGIFLDKSADPGEYAVRVKEGEYWNYELIRTPCDTYDIVESPKPEGAPARAWHKIDEACKHFDWKIKAGEIVIEIGSAPGGISYYLLDKGAELYAVDPAKMDPSLKGFKHIQRSIFDVDRRDLPTHCDWLISDLNLSGDLNVVQCARIAAYYSKLKGGFLTIKTPQDFDVKHMKKWAKSFENFETTLFHLPSHRREIGLFFRNTALSN